MSPTIRFAAASVAFAAAVFAGGSVAAAANPSLQYDAHDPSTPVLVTVTCPAGSPAISGHRADGTPFAAGASEASHQFTIDAHGVYGTVTISAWCDAGGVKSAPDGGAGGPVTLVAVISDPTAVTSTVQTTIPVPASTLPATPSTLVADPASTLPATTIPRVASGGGLPDTGSNDSGTLAICAGALIAAGAALVTLTPGRRAR